MNKLSERSKKNLIGIHPDLKSLIELAVVDCPIDFTVTSGVRSIKEQQELYAQGRTKPGSVVTNADGIRNKSNHQAKSDGYGHAVDLYPFRNGKVQVSDVAGLTIIAKHIKKVADQLNIEVAWGGDWKMKDYPHFELKS